MILAGRSPPAGVDREGTGVKASSLLSIASGRGELLGVELGFGAGVILAGLIPES
jgi:hypothetical protein